MPAPIPPVRARDVVPRRRWHSISALAGGPVLKKELWMLGKRLSTSWIRFLYVGALLLILVLVLLAATRTTRYAAGGGLSALQAIQQVAPSIAIALIWFQILMISLMGCVLGGSAICDEVRAGSLGTLLTTPLRAWQIVMGKLLGRGMELAILVLVALPIVLSIRVLGGVPVMPVIAAACVAMCHGLLAVQLAMFESARTRHAASAIAVAIVLLGVLWAVPSILLGMVTAMGASLGFQVPVFVVGMLSAPAAMFSITGEILADASPLGFVSWWQHCLVVLALTGLLFFATTLRVRSAMHLVAVHGPGGGRSERKRRSDARGKAVAVEPEAEQPHQSQAQASNPDASEPDASRLPKKRARRVMRSEGYSREVGDNPVYWREMQQRMVRGRVTLPLALALGINIAFGLYWMSSLTEPVQVLLASIGAVVLCLLAALQTGSAIASEREGRTLDALLATPLSARQILWGKLGGAARRMLPLYLAIALHLVLSGLVPNLVSLVFRPLDAAVRLMSVMDRTGRIRDFLPQHIDNHWQSYWEASWNPDSIPLLGIVIALSLLASTVFFQLATGLLFSTVLKRSTPATLANLMLTLGLALFVPIMLVIVEEDLLQFYCGFHPGVLFGLALVDGDRPIWSRKFGFPVNDIPFEVYIFLCFFVCLALVGAGLVAMRIAASELGFAGGRKA